MLYIDPKETAFLIIENPFNMAKAKKTKKAIVPAQKSAPAKKKKEKGTKEKTGPAWERGESIPCAENETE